MKPKTTDNIKNKKDLNKNMQNYFQFHIRMPLTDRYLYLFYLLKMK